MYLVNRPKEMVMPPSPLPTPATPLRMLFAVALLALYTCFAAWLALSEHAWAYLLVALLTGVACAGTALLKPWSQYLVYLLTAAFIAVWVFSLYGSYRVGFFHFISTPQLVRFLAPDAVMVVMACYCSYAVFSNFRRPR